MSISLIAAVAENNVIGKKGGIPWHLPEDLKRFKELTMGHPVIMGRKTFESILTILGKPLPGRTNVVVTRQNDYAVPAEVEKYTSTEEALAAHKGEEVFVIGGGEIYAQTIDRADTLYITHVEKTVEGDAFFPPFSQEEWGLREEEKHDGYRFAAYTRRQSSKRITAP